MKIFLRLKIFIGLLIFMMNVTSFVNSSWARNGLEECLVGYKDLATKNKFRAMANSYSAKHCFWAFGAASQSEADQKALNICQKEFADCIVLETEGDLERLQKRQSQDRRQDATNLKEAQLKLKERGLYAGKIDGQLGAEIITAIKNFQKSAGSNVTGQLDKWTLSQLKTSDYIPSVSQLASASKAFVCFQALSSSLDRWDEDFLNAKSVAEAKRRNLTIADCQAVINQTPSDSSNRMVQISSKNNNQTIDEVKSPSFKDCEVCPEMISIPAGNFLMGISENEEEQTNLPLFYRGNASAKRRISINSIAISKFKITFKEFKEFAKDQTIISNRCVVWTGREWKLDESRGWLDPGYRQLDQNPVTCVDWYDADKYAQWLSVKTGKKYRLATEAEWEYAARAGTDTFYYFGNEANRLGKYAWFGENSGAKANPVGTKLPNRFGLYDMHGNGWEWIADCWVKLNNSTTNGVNSSDCMRSMKVMKGGSWINSPGFLRSGMRIGYNALDKASEFTIRVVRDLDENLKAGIENQSELAKADTNQENSSELKSSSPLNNMSAMIICTNSMNRDRSDWDVNYQYRDWVNEAKSRGYTLESCRVALGLPAQNLNLNTEVKNSQFKSKLALVIGNSDYANADKLINPKNDANAMSTMLSSLGFKVILSLDAKKSEMENSIREFIKESKSSDLTLFFYAGHGMEVAGENFLLPVDAKLEDEVALNFEVINSKLITNSMGGPEKVGIILLDACRNNPFTRSLKRSLASSRAATISNGLAPIGLDNGGLMVAFATSPGSTAEDGDGQNSPFTTALLKWFPQKGLELEQVMKRVKIEVSTATKNSQRPWTNSDLTKDVFISDN